ncbi:MAG: response regulator [Methylococcales bacterium]|nr:response regulator [Methylococcales bacterium]
MTPFPPLTDADGLPSLAEYSGLIGLLGDQAADAGYFGFQDVCLLLAEVLVELSPESLSEDSIVALQALPSHFGAYCQGSAVAIGELLALLQRPELPCGLAEDELAMLASQLALDQAAQATGHPDPQIPEPLEDVLPLSVVETEFVDNELINIDTDPVFQLAERAANDGYYGFQDACLLIAEALAEQTQSGLGEDSLAALAGLPLLYEEYSSGANPAIASVVALLQMPRLGLDLAEDELATLTDQLHTDMPKPNDQSTLLNDEAPGLSKEVLALVGLLAGEADVIDGMLDKIAAQTDCPAGHLGQLCDELERYINASRMAGFEGLALVFGQVNANLELFTEDANRFTTEHLVLLQDWIGLVKGYLANFSDRDSGLPMLAQLGAPEWPLPVNLDDATAILAQLSMASTSVFDEGQPARKQTAYPEDVTLALPDDVNPELLDILLHELPIQIAAFSTAIQHLDRGGSLADLDIAQRVAHTVKGAANTVGIKGIAELTHNLEDILLAFAQHQQLPGRKLLDVLIDAADCLEAMAESLISHSAAPGEALTVLQSVLDWANQIDQAGIGAIIDVPVIQTQAETTTSNAVDHTPGAAPEPSGQPQATMVRVTAGQIDELFKLAGENVILNSQANERLRRIKIQLRGMELQFGLLRQLGDELEQLIDLKDLSGQALADVDASFDALEMDQYNELHTASRRMVEAAFDAREMTLDADKELEAMGVLLEDQHRLVNETQAALMETRLTPVSSIAQRLQRALRQTCRLTGKQCNLNLTGEHLMVDGDTLNALIEPLMHVLRNAVDHGIETAEAREAVGKVPYGTISVGFDYDSNHIRIRVQDDGRGLDFAAIREAAERRGVIAAGQVVPEKDLARYILRPNFTTRTQATQISGRGVGMDAVYHQVQAQGGSLVLHSEPGQGLLVEINIPPPLSRAHALLAHVGPYGVAISSKGINQILFAGMGDVHLLDEGQRVQIGDDNYPAITLNKLLRVPERRKRAQSHHTVLLVQHNDELTGVLLDAINESLDIVIKNFGFYIKKIPGFIGAAILGDGSVAPVLDLPELLMAIDGSGDANIYLESHESPTASLRLPTVLLVDDSLSQRRALEQLLQDAGFQVRTARDGIEATEKLAELMPDIVLTDLEMPRMNGIELTAHIRTRENLKSVPVIMITSRTTQAHRKMAMDAGTDFYLVKPVREDDLLEKIQSLINSAVLAA